MANDESKPRWAKWLAVGAVAGGALLAASMLRQPQEVVRQPQQRDGAAETEDRFGALSFFQEPEPEPAEAARQLLPLALRTAAKIRCAEADNEDKLVEGLMGVMHDGGVELVRGPNWQVVPNRRDQGEGDLVFRWDSVDFVVEVKFIRIAANGPNNCHKRTANRKLVKEQALRYSSLWRSQNPGRRVVAATFTNDQGWVELADQSQPEGLSRSSGR